MSQQKVLFSPITRVSGLLSAALTIENDRVVEADISSTMFRGFEWIMRDHHVADAVYLTQRICGICSTVHGAVASYLLDELYDNEIEDNAQLIRNIMLGADFLQNHIRHFYFFSLPDFVVMPQHPPFHAQNCLDCRFDDADNRRLAGHYNEAVRASAKCHQLLALFGGKAPHQHSFVHGGAAVKPTADKITQALALLGEIAEFIKSRLLPDTECIARRYEDYYEIGVTPGRFLSFGLFRFGRKNETTLWRGGVLVDGACYEPKIDIIQEDITRAWYERQSWQQQSQPEPDPYKLSGYTWIKAVQYGGRHFEGGPLARMLLNGFYQGQSSTMDRIMARSIETALIADLLQEWLLALVPGDAPIRQNKELTKDIAVNATDAMRGPLLHSARLIGDRVDKYDIITPTVWNFAPKDSAGRRGPVESALVGTAIEQSELQYSILGRIIRSFDPCLSCATHVYDAVSQVQTRMVY